MFETRRVSIWMIGLALFMFAGMHAASEDSEIKKKEEKLSLHFAFVPGVASKPWNINAEVSLVNNGQETITHEFDYYNFDFLKFELLDQAGKSLVISFPLITLVSEIGTEELLTEEIAPGKWLRREFHPLSGSPELQNELKEETYYQLVAIMTVRIRNKDGTTTRQEVKSNPSTFRVGVRKPNNPQLDIPSND